MEDSTDEKRILRHDLDFYGMNEGNLPNKRRKMCFQTFSPSWMQVSTV